MPKNDQKTPIQLLGLPQDNNVSYLSGPCMAPTRIREALFCDSANLWTETGFDLSDKKLWQDAGDVSLYDKTGLEAFELIHTSITKLVKSGYQVLSLGGDHSVSFPAISAHAENHGRLSILHIDAHPDLYDDMQGNSYSHASPFARLMESGLIDRLVQIGIRTLNGHQREQAARFGVEIHEMCDLSQVGSISFDRPVYLSLDMDALDPAFAPGVSHYEPGGLSTRAVLDVIHNFSGQLIGADVVELNPHRDPGNVTAMVAAKFTKEIMGRILIDRK
ncbi:agmatinase [uncultured Roseovarius sp.]|uniref:agmatinase n=1 Tax=uncultured Roseovarius sp. TaxID=293344 RepID=UPI00261D8CC6|nr:agmatinase [uncultured Roseovarius sp.]